MISLFASLLALGQEEEKNWTLDGYVKDLLTINLTGDSVLFDNLVHNRLNFNWFPNDHINVYLEVRNRFFFGETVKAVPGYGALIDVNNDYFDLSAMGEGKSWVAHSMIDRAYLEWYKGNWEIRAGRQRINWGINTIWNPNDIFNAYSFFDFDYEERPGSDAIRIKRYTGVASSIELAGNVASRFDDMVLAGMWKWNKWSYDFQVLAGKAGKDLVLGAGWAGNIKTAGFKGEITSFHPYSTDSLGRHSLVASFAVDYTFESSLYLNGAVLYNSAAPRKLSLEQGLNVFRQDRLTAKDLSPFRYALLGQFQYPFHPLINGGLVVIYYPGNRNALFLNPNVAISLKTNLDLHLISQVYFDKFTDGYKARARVFFLRVKWSF